MQNISKYLQVSDHILLEYEFNKSTDPSTAINISVLGANVATDNWGILTYYNGTGVNGILGANSYGITNNTLLLSSGSANQGRTSWYTPLIQSNVGSFFTSYYTNHQSITGTTLYQHDTIRLHTVVGYNFDDIAGFILQVGAYDVSSNFVSLSNFTWAKQFSGSLVTDVLHFSPNTLQLGNKFYDKYIEFKVPSVQNLGGDTTTTLGQTLNIRALSDVVMTFSNIGVINNNSFVVSNTNKFQLPVTSPADSFGAFIAESTAGDYIEYYATWNGVIIGSVMNDIESGVIKLYTSNNPNDNYAEFANQFGYDAAKWVLLHDIYVYEQIPGPTGGSSLLVQKLSFTQEDNFSSPNYFRPVLPDADISSSYSIIFTCRLINRMDGTQIIRQASFSSTNPTKYGRYFTKLNVSNVLPFKVFNRLEPEKAVIANDNKQKEIRYIKVFYDTTNVYLNQNNELQEQGTGSLYLKNDDSVYKFNFIKIDDNNQRVAVDLSGFEYILSFTLSDNTTIEIPATYSENMQTTAGQLEFKIQKKDLTKILNNTTDKTFNIMVYNNAGDKSKIVFYTGNFYPISQKQNLTMK